MKTIGLISANYAGNEFSALTESRTMATIPFGGRYRLIDFTLSNMVNSGISTVGVISPYNSSSLIDHLGTGKNWSLGSKIGGLFIMPGSVYGLRSANTRFLLRDIVENHRFLEKDNADYVIFSNSTDVLNIDYKPLIEAHHKSSAPITLLCAKVDEDRKYEGFFLKKNVKGKVVKISRTCEKGDAYFMDSFIANRKFILDFITCFSSLGHMDLMDILKDNIIQTDVRAYEFSGYLGMINNLNDFLNVNMDLLNNKIRRELLFDKYRGIRTKIQDEHPVYYASGSNVNNSIISAGCIIEGEVKNSIIFRSTHIAKGASVKNSIIMMHNNIEENACLENIICDKNVNAGKGTKLEGGKGRPIVIRKGRSI